MHTRRRRAIVNICDQDFSGGFLPGFLGGRFVGAFDELAFLEFGTSADEGDQVWCVNRAPARLGGLNQPVGRGVCPTAFQISANAFFAPELADFGSAARTFAIL